MFECTVILVSYTIRIINMKLFSCNTVGFISFEHFYRHLLKLRRTLDLDIWYIQKWKRKHVLGRAFYVLVGKVLSSESIPSVLSDRYYMWKNEKLNTYFFMTWKMICLHLTNIKFLLQKPHLFTRINDLLFFCSHVWSVLNRHFI